MEVGSDCVDLGVGAVGLGWMSCGYGGEEGDGRKATAALHAPVGSRWRRTRLCSWLCRLGCRDEGERGREGRKKKRESEGWIGLGLFIGSI